MEQLLYINDAGWIEYTNITMLQMYHYTLRKKLNAGSKHFMSGSRSEPLQVKFTDLVRKDSAV